MPALRLAEPPSGGSPGSAGARMVSLLAACAGWLGGTGWQMQWAALPPPSAAAWAAAAALAMMLVLLAPARWLPRRHAPRWLRPALWLLAAALAAAAAATLRAHERLAERLPAALEGRDIVVTGLVAQLPRAGVQGARFLFEVDEATLDGTAVALPRRLSLGWYRAAEPDLLLLGPQVEVRAGQRWRFTVRLKQPHGALNPGGFDLELWLFERGIGATGSVRSRHGDAARLLDEAGGAPLERARQRVRDAIERRLLLAGGGGGDGVRDDGPFTARIAGVIAALAVGDQAAIERDDWELFRLTGVAHLMSISGLHVTMFAWLAGLAIGTLWRHGGRAALRLPAPLAARFGGVAAALAYALVAGWGVPAQRTVWMLATLAVLHGLAARWPLPAVLAVVAAVVIAVDPWAFTQPGFWLSFVAVALLAAAQPAGRGGGAVRSAGGASPQGAGRGAAGSPWRARLLRPVLRVLQMAGAGVRTQAVATVGLAPLSMIFFQQVSLLGFAANLLAIPVVTLVVTPLALLGVLAAPLWDAAAAVLWALVAALQALLAAGQGAAPAWLPAVWQAAAAPPWAMAAGLAGGTLAVLPLPAALRLLALPLLLPLLAPAVARPAAGAFEVVAADVGQGTAVLVRTRGHLLVYDAGPAWGPDADAGSRLLVPLLRWRGEERIDLLMISHRDADHAGGAAALLSALPVRAFASSLDEADPLPARARAAGATVRRCAAGQRWQWDGVPFEVLHPPAADAAAAGVAGAADAAAADAADAVTPGVAGAAAVAGSAGTAGTSIKPPRPNALSCVLRIGEGERSVLLTGDIEAAQEAALLARAPQGLRAGTLLVPHHGSRTSSTPAFVDAVAPRLAVVQAGYRSRFGHPAPDVMARYEARGIDVRRSDRCGALTLPAAADAPASAGAPPPRCERDAARRYWHHGHHGHHGHTGTRGTPGVPGVPNQRAAPDMTVSGKPRRTPGRTGIIVRPTRPRRRADDGRAPAASHRPGASSHRPQPMSSQPAHAPSLPASAPVAAAGVPDAMARGTVLEAAAGPGDGGSGDGGDSGDGDGRSSAFWNELHDAEGRLRPAWQRFAAAVPVLAAAPAAAGGELDRRVAQVAEELRREGALDDARTSLHDRAARPPSLQLLPQLVSPADWSIIEAGIAQRAALLEAMLADLHGPQRLLREGLLPPALLWRHPGWLLPLAGARPAGGQRLFIVGFDLGRDAGGHWCVLGQRTQGPSGLGAVLHNRFVVARQFPEAFRDLRVQHVASSYRTLLASVEQRAAALLAGGSGTPRIVLLTPGPGGRAWPEHAWLARHLGLPLAEGGDLTVRGEQLFLKTVEGLERVHGVLRRVDDEWCDPLELRPDSALGVPGLVQAVRAGTVVVANALGSGFLETPALHGFLPAIARRLLGAPLMLPSLASWWCGEAAAWADARGRLAGLVARDTFAAFDDRTPAAGTRLPDPAAIDADPDAFTLQARPWLSRAPTWGAGKVQLRPAVVRVFAIADAAGRWHVLPGGLTRIAAGGACLDTWVLTDGPVDTFSMLPPKLTVDDLAARRRPVASRTGENLFWFGRYSERSEQMVRLARTMLALIDSDNDAAAPELRALTALAVRSGLAPAGVAGLDRAPQAFERAVLAALPAHGSGAFSIGHGLHALAEAAAALSERLAPEQVRLVGHLREAFEEALRGRTGAAAPPGSTGAAAPPGRVEALAALDRLALHLGALTGAQADRMTHDHGWRLLTVGRLVERLLGLAARWQVFLAERALDRAAGVELLLELCDSLITFRARHQRHEDLLPLTEVLVLDETEPRSLAGVLRRLRHELDQLPPLPAQASPLAALLPAAGAGLALADLRGLGEAELAERLRRLVDTLAEAGAALVAEVSERYFNPAHGHDQRV